MNVSTDTNGETGWRMNLVRSPLTRFRLTGVGYDDVAALPDEPYYPGVTPVPGLAEGFYLGRYRLAGHEYERSYPPFSADGFGDEPPAWSEALHGFGWLRPLRDPLRETGTPLARSNAQGLVLDWITTVGTDLRHPAWEPLVAARRLDAWLTHHAWLTEDAPADMRRALAKSLGYHIRALRSMGSAVRGEDRAYVGITLALAYAATGGGSRGMSLVQSGLRAWTGDDGGPRSGEPREAVRMLAGLSRVAAARPSAPAFLGLAITGLKVWLAGRRHADGTLAQFHGTGWLPAVLLTRLIGDAAPSAGPRLARLNGSGGAVALMDGGGTFESAGAFELSVPAGRIIVSCGVPERDGPLRDALTGWPAHSGLDTPGPAAIVERLESEGNEARIAIRYGTATHRRRLVFQADGLTGTDALESETEGRLRFHVHHEIAASVEGPNAISLTLPDGERWMFYCVDGELRLEETMIFACDAEDFASGHGRPSTQIVVEMPESNGTRELRWMFVRRA